MESGPRRADAQRNRERLLAAAREVFADRGVGAPLDEVARRAGVGNATMYRHFADRRELALAVYADEVDALCERGADLLGAADPGAALFDWLGAFVDHVSSKRDLAELGTADQPSSRYAQWHEAMHRTAANLVDRARQAGAVRPDLDAADLLVLVAGIALTGTTADRTRRLLTLIRHGTDAH